MGSVPPTSRNSRLGQMTQHQSSEMPVRRANTVQLFDENYQSAFDRIHCELEKDTERLRQRIEANFESLTDDLHKGPSHISAILQSVYKILGEFPQDSHQLLSPSQVRSDPVLSQSFEPEIDSTRRSIANAFHNYRTLLEEDIDNFRCCTEDSISEFRREAEDKIRDFQRRSMEDRGTNYDSTRQSVQQFRDKLKTSIEMFRAIREANIDNLHGLIDSFADSYSDVFETIFERLRRVAKLRE